MNLKKLYIVTGKGGVGKTLFSFALASYLKEASDKKVLINSFEHEVDQELLKELELEELRLPIIDSTIEYVGRKIKSHTLAKWVMTTPFFKALFNMVPSLANMITFGHIIDYLENNDETILVVDAPSSGHILTILESPLNFQKIFKSGALVKDINRMLNFTNSEQVECWVLSIPTELAIVEGQELSQKIKSLGISETKWILNNVLGENKEVMDALSKQEVPDFINKKMDAEQNTINQNTNKFQHVVPMFLDKSPLELVKNIRDIIKNELLRF